MEKPLKKFPKISVIIPNYNDAETLPLCLQATLALDYPDFEIIVVDDKSTDNSIEAIKKYQIKLLTHMKNRGQGAARNTGAKQAEGEILLFIDSDVCIKKDTLKKIVYIFYDKKNIEAVVGMPDKKCIYKNLSSMHFNRRIHFNYSKLPDYINILYGSISAVRKDIFSKMGGFDERISGVEDDELGFRLAEAGYKIYHSKEIQVVHYKNIRLLALFKNDFCRTVDRVKLLLGRRLLKKVYRERRFITSPPYQLLSPPFSFLFFFFFLGSIFYRLLILLSFFAFFIFLLLNLNYLFFNFKEEGVFFSIKLFILLLFDMLIVSLALAWGGLLFLKGEKY